MTRAKLMGKFFPFLGALLASFGSAWAQAQKYPSLEEYMMPRDAEITLASSAAPANISDVATVTVLTSSGFEIARQGTNGFVCLVMRGWAAPTFTPAEFRGLVYDPTVRAPICFNPAAARAVMPYYELRHKLGMQGKTPDQIADGVQAAYANGALPNREEFRSPTCGLLTRISDQESDIGIRT